MQNRVTAATLGAVNILLSYRKLYSIYYPSTLMSIKAHNSAIVTDVHSLSLGVTLHFRAMSLLYCALLYPTLLYSTVPYPTLLYPTLRFSTLFYSTVLYTTLLYFALLYSACSVICSASNFASLIQLYFGRSNLYSCCERKKLRSQACTERAFQGKEVWCCKVF